MAKICYHKKEKESFLVSCLPSMVAYFCHQKIISTHLQIFMLTCQIIMSSRQKKIPTSIRLKSCFHSILTPLTAKYLSIQHPTSPHNFPISRHNFLTNRRNCLKARLSRIILTCKILMSTCHILCRLVR